MIDKDTRVQVARLATTVEEAAIQLSALLSDFSESADQQLSLAAAAFLGAYEKREQHFGPFRDARDRLMRAASSATNLCEMAQRAHKLEGTGAYLANATRKGGNVDINRVCEIEADHIAAEDNYIRAQCPKIEANDPEFEAVKAQYHESTCTDDLLDQHTGFEFYMVPLTVDKEKVVRFIGRGRWCCFFYYYHREHWVFAVVPKG